MSQRIVRFYVRLVAVLLGIAGYACGQGLIVEPADIIVIHGRVYTENPKQPWAQAVAIRVTREQAILLRFPQIKLTGGISLYMAGLG